MTLTSFLLVPSSSPISNTGWIVPVDSQICMIGIQYPNCMIGIQQPLSISLSNRTNCFWSFTYYRDASIYPLSVFSFIFEIVDCFSLFPIWFSSLDSEYLIIGLLCSRWNRSHIIINIYQFIPFTHFSTFFVVEFIS